MRGVYLETILELARKRAVSTLDYLLEESAYILTNAHKKPFPLRLEYHDEQYCCVLVDTEGRIIYANDLACELMGKPPDAIVGRCVFGLVPAERSVPRKAILDEVVRSGNTYQYMDTDAQGRWYDARFVPIKRNGVVERVVYVAMQLEHAPEPFRVKVIQ